MYNNKNYQYFLKHYQFSMNNFLNTNHCSQNVEKNLYSINNKLFIKKISNNLSKKLFNKLNKNQIDFLYKNSFIDSELYFNKI